MYCACHVGGSASNREMDRVQWQLAPYTESDLQMQIDRAQEVYGARGAQVRSDLDEYVAGWRWDATLLFVVVNVVLPVAVGFRVGPAALVAFLGCEAVLFYGNFGVLVYCERKLMKDETNLIAVILLKNFQFGIERAAGRALVIAILVQCNLRVCPSARVRVVRRERR